MNMSRLHAYRLRDRFRSKGPGGIRHRARGRCPMRLSRRTNVSTKFCLG
ncbi:hypothetical protein [Labrenzia sp. THAF35]